MKIQEVVLQLSTRLPTLTDAFTDTLAVSSLIHAGTTGTIVTAEAHGLKVGDSVHVIGAINPVSIATITHSVGATVATVITSTDHDLTLYSSFDEGNVATIEGNLAGVWDGTFTLAAVNNRRSFDITVSATASDFMEEATGDLLTTGEAGATYRLTAFASTPDFTQFSTGCPITVRNITTDTTGAFTVHSWVDTPGSEILYITEVGGPVDPGPFLGVGEGFEVKFDGSRAPGVATNASNYFNTIRGQYAVATVTNSTTFTVEHTLATGLGTMTGTIEARVKPRITGGIDDEGAIASYTRDAEDPATLDRPAKVWAYVILGPTTSSRGPRHGTDGIDDQSRSEDWQQQLLTPFQVLVVQSASDQTLGRNARDVAEDLLRPILRSILGKKFTSGLAQAIGSEVQFVGHGVARYDGATYWHEFNFEQRSTIEFADTIGADDDVAFRDWDFTGDPDIDALDGEGEVVQVTSLDDTPL